MKIKLNLFIMKAIIYFNRLVNKAIKYTQVNKFRGYFY